MNELRSGTPSKTVKGLFWVLTIFVLFLLAFIIFSAAKVKGSIPEYKGCDTVTFVGKYSADSSPWQEVTDNDFIDKSFDNITFRGTLDRDIPQGKMLYFYFRDCYAEVYLNGNNIANFGKNNPIFHSVGSGWIEHFSEGITKDAVFEIHIHPCYQNCEKACESFLHRIKTGTGGAIYRDMFSENIIMMFVCIFIFCTGLITLVVSAMEEAHKTDEAGNIASFGLFCTIGGVWMFCSAFYEYLPLMIPNAYIGSLLYAAVVPILPITIGLSIALHIKTPSSRLICELEIVYFLLICAVVFTSQAAGLLDIYEAQKYYVPLLFLPLPPTIFIVCREISKEKNKSLLYLVISYIPLLLCLIIESINHHFIRFMPPRIMPTAGILVASIIRIFMITLIVRRRAETKQRYIDEIRESNTAIMLSQIQPHFLYNTLSVIKWLCKTDSSQAEVAIDNFSDFLRGNMDSISSIKMIPFEQELNHTKSYLNLEKMRFGDRLNIVFNINETDFRIPPLSIQPIVENAVRYGVTKKVNGGTIIIASDKTDSAYTVTISDDGVGFDTANQPSDGRRHIGIENVRSRLRAVCGGTLDVIGAPGIGTVAVITLPIE